MPGREDRELFLLQDRHQRQEYGGRLIFLRILCSAHFILNTSRSSGRIAMPAAASRCWFPRATGRDYTKHISRGAMQGTLRALARATNNPPTLRRQCDRDPEASSMVVCPPIHLRRPHGESLQDVKRSPDLASPAR